MNKHQIASSEDITQVLDNEVLLSVRAFDTDPSTTILESSDPQKLRFTLIEWLNQSPNRKVKAERKQSISEILKISIRQVERLSKKYQEYRLNENAGIDRGDKGEYRIDEYWQEYIRSVYEESVKQKHPLTAADVVREVMRRAVIDLHHEEGDYPHRSTIYRILKPLQEHYKRKQQIRNPGAGSWLAVETRDGQLLKADYSNQIIQCDHTKLDIRIVDEEGNLLSWRPWLTTVIDTFSSALIGYHVWHKQPGAHEVALTLRHAALPKFYPPEYELAKSWDICGLPLQYLFTDGGKDLASAKLIKLFSKKLGFKCELRDRPSQGGIVERLFGSINTECLAKLPGYISKKVKDGAARAEKEACLTVEDIDKNLALYFCDDYNHKPYPKDPRETRFERWLKGMGGKLPEAIEERQLDILLMKEEKRVVQEHGSFHFLTKVYRGEELKSFQGQYVYFRYDPDHILTLYVYKQSIENEKDEFIGYAHALNMDTQDLSMEELQEINKSRSSAKRKHSNYDALLALDKRNKRAETRKKEKKQKQQLAQKELRAKSKQNSDVVKIRKERGSNSSQQRQTPELLPSRVSPEQIQPQLLQPKPQDIPESNPAKSQPQERHRLIVNKKNY